MFNNMKYSIKRALRDKEFMLSSILVAVAMGTVMFFMTDSMMDQVNDGTFYIPVAVVESNADEQTIFGNILAEIDMLELTFMDMDDALYALETGDISGIFEIGYADEPRLLVTENAMFSARILHSIIDEYVMNSQIFTDIAMNNPQYLESALMNIADQGAVTTQMDLTDSVIDVMQMFMIMFVTTSALAGIFVGFARAIEANNDQHLGSRRLVSSFGKMKLLMTDLLGVTIVSVGIAFATWAYFALVLGVELQVNLWLAGLSFFLTSLFGVALGAFFGLVAPGTKKVREQILTGAYMGMIMLGFMGSQFGNETVNRINEYNPLMVLVDAIMALNLGSYDRYIGFMIILGVSAVVMLIATIFALRRTRHVDAN
ncbi:MAG: ABC transporter permease [Turicibacter sp.]|nr:ABC transporter permease [Turicibacter sp.]